MVYVRSGLIKGFFVEENNEFFLYDIRKSGFLDYVKFELKDIFMVMNVFYKECIGSEL